MTSADHNTVQINEIKSDGTVGDRKNYISTILVCQGQAYISNILIQALALTKHLACSKSELLILQSCLAKRDGDLIPIRCFTAKVFILMLYLWYIWFVDHVGANSWIGISGSFKGPYDIAPVAQNTYNSQNTFELTIKGSQTTTYIYMGDSWDSKGGPSSTYIWLPMAVSASAKTVTLQYHAMWKVDTKTGVVSWPVSKKRYEAEHAIITGRAGELLLTQILKTSVNISPVVSNCDECISKRSVHQGKIQLLENV